VVVGCGLLVALSPPAAQARPRLEGHPKPPSQAQINAGGEQGAAAAAAAAFVRIDGMYQPGGLIGAVRPAG
jgi:hypothetical protein